MATYWLDFGGGDGEYFERIAKGMNGDENIFVSADPFLRSHVIEAQRVRSRNDLPANVFRVGTGLGPSDDCVNRFLPFRDGAFQHVVCRFVLHLYLTVTETFMVEAHRVLTPDGDLTIRVPHWGNELSASNVNFIVETLQDKGFSLIAAANAEDELCSLWDEIYQGHAYELKAAKRT
jgi:SAM-dependent methyltransferase